MDRISSHLSQRGKRGASNETMSKKHHDTNLVATGCAESLWLWSVRLVCSKGCGVSHCWFLTLFMQCYSSILNNRDELLNLI